MDPSDPSQETEAAVQLLRDFVHTDLDNGHVRLDWHQASAILVEVQALRELVRRLTPVEPF